MLARETGAEGTSLANLESRLSRRESYICVTMQHARTPPLQTQAEPAVDGLESVDRALAELRRGGSVVIHNDAASQPILICAAEMIDQWPPPFFEAAAEAPSLIVTGRRAAILGLTQPGARAVQLHVTQPLDLARVRALIDPQAESLPPSGVTAIAVAAHEPADAAIMLAKLARLLPAVIVAPIERGHAAAWAAAKNRLTVSVTAIERYDCDFANTLSPISEAVVPLVDSAETRLISFRPKDGGAEHLAIVIGKPDVSKPVLCRLHSECLTGDLLGSLRCDCGDQLRGGIAAIAREGSGVLLYLAQEGRGIGLVNKLRAYALQDQGFDTVDANEQLGFDDDERVYLPAVRMLRCLDISRVRLLTNNPAKVGALARHGIEVTERVPHAFPSNAHNAAYLQTKAKRSGHLL